MSYEIGTGDLQRHIGSLASTAAAAPVRPKESSSAGEEALHAAGADQTKLSSLGGLVSQAFEGSDTRTAKVASLQEAISTGQYNVSSSDVADKLIQSLLE